MNKKVSVVIPTYKGQDTLKRAIESIMRQTYTNIEIIVVDDNTPETKERKETEALIKTLNLDNLIYLKHKKNKNGAAARNTGIRKATGEYICFLDDDDAYMKTRIEKSVEALEKNHEYGILLCDVVHFGDSWMGKVYKMDERNLTPEAIMLNEGALGTGSNLFLRTEIVRQLNGFDESFLRHQDLEFAIRAVSVTNPLLIHEILVAKCFNGNDNQPDYYKLKQIKKCYNEKFAYVINGMDSEIRNQYFLKCYMNLYGAALCSGKWANIQECVEALQKVGFSYNLKRKLQVFLSISGINKTAIYKKIIRCRNLKENINVENIDVRTIAPALREELTLVFGQYI